MGENGETAAFDIKRVQKALNISDPMVEHCAIGLVELEKIYNDYIGRIPQLEKTRVEILSGLHEKLPRTVHSIRSRVKQADHLIGKIIRGYYRNPDRYKGLNAENYHKIITDLIGIRIIILDRRDWKDIHQELIRMFRCIPDRYCQRPLDIIANYDWYANEVNATGELPDCAYHAEQPVVYITSEEDKQFYQDPFLRADTSKGHYRSIHYIIRYKDTYFEIQMRSLFEEGWLEFDHRMKYPNDQYNRKKQEYIRILGNLANAADELISYYEESDFTEKEKEGFRNDPFQLYDFPEKDI